MPGSVHRGWNTYVESVGWKNDLQENGSRILLALTGLGLVIKHELFIFPYRLKKELHCIDGEQDSRNHTFISVWCCSAHQS